MTGSLIRGVILLRDRLRYTLTEDDRTEDFYRYQYERFFARFYSPENGCLRVGSLRPSTAAVGL